MTLEVNTSATQFPWASLIHDGSVLRREIKAINPWLTALIRNLVKIPREAFPHSQPLHTRNSQCML